MTKENRTYSRKKAGCLIALLGFIALLFFARLALKSPLLFDIVTRYAVSQANDMLEAELEVDRIRGDLLSGFTIYDLSLRENSGEVVAQIDSVGLRYSVWSLIWSPHTVRSVHINEADVMLRQEWDSTWNVLNMLPEPEEESEESTLEWEVEQIEIVSGDIRIESDILLPDGWAEIGNLQTRVAAGSDQQGFFATLHDLQFDLTEQRLPGPVLVLLEDGELQQDHYTLETLLIETGRSWLQGTLQQTGESVDGELRLDPLSRDDLAAYVDSLPLMHDITLSLTARGTLQDLNLTLQASATGLQEAVLEAGISLGDEPVLTSFHMQLSEADFPLLTGLESSPVIGEVTFTGEGRLTAGDYENGDWDGGLVVRNLIYDAYQIDQIDTDIAYLSGTINSSWVIANSGEEIRMQLDGENLFDERPGWDGTITGSNLNLAAWAGETFPESDVDITLALNGRGFSPESVEADLHAELRGGHIGEHSFQHLIADLRADSVSAEASLDAALLDGTADLRLLAENWRDEMPEFRFDLEMSELDASHIQGFEEFPTRFNGTITGSGRGLSPEVLTLEMVAELDSTIINGEQIDTFTMDIIVEDQFVSIEEGVLSSPIADGQFTALHHITDFTDVRNQAELSLQLKDLSSLAPLFGFENLRMSGTARAQLSRTEQNILRLDSAFDFNDIEMDSLFLADSMDGEISGDITDEPEIEYQAVVSQALVSGQKIQNVNAFGTAILQEEETSGSIGLVFSGGPENALSHQGEFSIRTGEIVLQTTELSFQTETRELVLERPFETRVEEGLVRMDTLSIRNADDEAYLRLWIPHLDSLSQQAGLEARNLNVGELQRTLTGESMAEGLLSASAWLSNQDEELTVEATGIIEQLVLDETEMDSLRFNADLAGEWLEADFYAWNLTEELLSLNLRIPFLPGDPLTFDEQFFEREVEGNFTLHESDITYWLGFLPDGIPEETAGRVSAQGELNGMAGNPFLSGELLINDALLSGIDVDSLSLGLQYEHDSGTAMLNGSVVKDAASILDFRSALPLIVDLRAGEVQLPSDQDSIVVEADALDFNLAMFNNYMPPELIQGLEGIIEGRVSLHGQIGDLEAEGTLRLRNGRLRAIPAGITLQDMEGDLNFESDRITLSGFSVDSGPGSLQASGMVMMDGLSAGEMDIRLEASQFRLLNTAELSAIANMDASLTGTSELPELIGSITFLNTEVNLQNFGEQAVEQVALEGEEEADSISFYERMRMELNVNFGRNFYIMSSQYLDMQFVLGGEVDLVKESEQELELFGTIEGTSGYARPLGKNFELDEAFVTFYGPMDNPDLDIHTVYEPPQAAGVRIYYIIEGSLEDPEFRFDSEPSLELQDIISYTIFGKPFYELESWEQVVAGTGSGPSATDLAMDVLLDRVEMLASQRLGIDVVQIDNNRSGSGSTTTIKTGWYLNQKTFFAILNEVGGVRPKTLFILEYLLRENLELIITQGDDSREGVDLRWHLDY